MKPIIILGIVFLIVVLAAIGIIVVVKVLNERNEKRNAQVLLHSKKIAALLRFNKEINFHNIESGFSINKHYDNKGNYNRIEPAYLMTAEIRDRVDFFQEYFRKIKENREKKSLYQKKISEIRRKKFDIDLETIEMSLEEFLKREEALFINYILNPTVECIFNVRMRYTSPKGKVDLSKSATFHFNEMFACLESISRSHMDKKTYSQLSLVERGEVSDSLRYDILNRDNFKCVICGASSKEGARLHVDHIIPIAKGGKSHPSNLRTLCERCNIGKSKKIETPVAKKDAETIKNNQKHCLWCGAALVLRKGKYGDFYGCSTYPKCKFTKKL